jgi:arabinofuranosyltransferase
MTRITFRYAAIALVAVAMLLSSLFFYSSNRCPDDAYISLRYARNLAEGEGLCFNPGGERVEGFSSPMHVLLMGAAISLGADPRHVSQFSSIFGAVLCVSVVAWWGQRRLGFWWGTFAALAVALNPSVGTWARGGLESTLFMALVVMALIAAAEERWTTMAVFAGLLALTRPEGLLYWLPLFLYALYVLRRDYRAIGIPVLLTLGTYLTWFIFRVLYFHDILPNTYYAKMDGVRAAQTRRGLAYVGEFLGRSEILIPMVLTGVALLAIGFRQRSQAGRFWGWPPVAAGLASASAVFAILAGGDHMNHFRFLLPMIPLVMLLGAWAGHRLAEMVPHRPLRIVLAAVLALVFLSQPIRIASHDLRHPYLPLDRPIGLVEPFDDRNIRQLYKLGIELKKVLSPDAVIAIIPAGAIPYASELTTIDMLGLNDRLIAKQPGVSMGSGRMGHEKGNGALVLDRRPDVLLMRNQINPIPGVPSQPDSSDFFYKPIREIWETKSFHLDYEPFVVKVDDKATYTLFRRRQTGH